MKKYEITLSALIFYVDANNEEDAEDKLFDEVIPFTFTADDVEIVRREYVNGEVFITLDKHFWSYSRTTGKYRNTFLGETKKETLKKIDSGEYELAELN